MSPPLHCLILSTGVSFVFFFGCGVGGTVTGPAAADFAFAFALPFATAAAAAAAAAADVFFEMSGGCFAAADVFVLPLPSGK